jgi:mannose-1-phosphate guanylyltransferase
MRYAMIMAGGSGTRLWPMSRGALPKQLIPFIDGKSLLQVAYDRFEGLIPAENRYICAGQRHREAILDAMPALDGTRLLSEPVGRDTLNAVGFTAAVLRRDDPDAVIGVFTADHIIQPVDEFRAIVERGFCLVERDPETLVTFGITPTEPATGYGYLQMGTTITETARVVEQFREKPPRDVAERYFREGPDHYLWNSGMFVWRAATLLDCIRRYEPDVAEGLARIAESWNTPDRDAVLQTVFPQLKKISVDFAVMEPASRDPALRVAGIPMQLEWIDVGSWPSFAETRPHDADGNALAAGKHLLLDTKGCLIASSEPQHLVATIGCEDMIVIHTDRATLVCPADQAQRIKDLQKVVDERFGSDYT